MSLRELYQEIIIDHGKHPRHFGKLLDASKTQVGHNPLCGDKLIIYIKEHDDIVDAVQFEGSGCAISVASASLMIESVQGKTRAHIEKLFSAFHNLLIERCEDESLGKLNVFSGVAEFPARVKCASLAWHTLKAALNNDHHPVSTE